MTEAEKLDLSSFEKAIFQLKDSLEMYHSDLVQKNPRLILHMRAAAIQAFEFTYELAWKTLKRYLEMTEPDPAEVDHMSFANLIRTGCERGLLLTELSAWKDYRRERGTTSHTYDQEKAIEILNKLPNFLQEAEYLFAQLKNRT